MATRGGGDVSLAQVEEELRAAEAYLCQFDASSAPAAASGDGAPSPSLQVQHAAAFADDAVQQHSEEATAHLHSPLDNDSFFRRRQKARPLLSEDRRKEILAKLSSERQAALRALKAGSPACNAETASPETSSPAVRRSSSRSAEERNQALQKLFQSDSSANSERHSQAFSDDGELFYASDIIGSGATAEIQPRSRMDLLYEQDDEVGRHHEVSIADGGSRDVTHTADSHKSLRRYEDDAASDSGEESAGEHNMSSSSPASLLAKLLLRESGDHPAASGHHAQLSAQANTPRDDTALVSERPARATVPSPAVRRRTVPQSEHEMQSEAPSEQGWTSSPGFRAQYQELPSGTDRFVPDSEPFQHDTRRATAGAAISRRIDFLAQPRIDRFSELEKQRLVLEMQSFQECTFRPDTTESRRKARSTTKDLPPREAERAKQSPRVEQRQAAFPWLMLSPRRKSSREGTGKVKWSDMERQRGQSVIQRLHLDGTARYEQREFAKAELEAQKLRECTFTPKINSTSKSMLSVGGYKPIHQRVSDIQRAKAEYIKRIQEKLESEEDGAAPFVPTINPISREIAAKANMERALESRLEYADGSDADEPDTCLSLKPPRVVERLVSDAERQAEKRIAIQEYYDAVQQQSFAPRISENSNVIVQQKPEFKMDFVSRQQHFQMQEREKLEALEDFCERAQNDGERITFKPDIGNADAVLRELRPDRFSENKSQKLYRMIYNDPKKTELKKQRLREEQYAKYTFKPAINPISKALGRSSTIAELAQPVTTLTDRIECDEAPSHQRRTPAKSSQQPSRAALQQYFAGKRFRSRVALEMEAAEKAECTFQPTLIAKPRVKGASSSTSKLYTKQRQGRSIWRSDNILHLIETDRVKKAEELEAKRNELELRELQECTFQPNVRQNGRGSTRRTRADGSIERSHSTEQKPVIVRGLGRFLEMKEQAKRLRAEQKLREDRAFRPNAAYEPRSYTVPKPFNLSESSKDAIRRRLKVREEVRAKEKLQCTFAPQTLESKHRKVLQNLLRE